MPTHRPLSKYVKESSLFIIETEQLNVLAFVIDLTARVTEQDKDINQLLNHPIP